MIMNSMKLGVCKVTVVAYMKVPLWHSPGVTEENHANP
jgi:hypothetical protein